MQTEQQYSDSHLFTVRVWREPVGDDSSEIRCQVRHVRSGETRHFRDWARFAEYLQGEFNEFYESSPMVPQSAIASQSKAPD
jgi:hypothetical protein